SENYSLPTGEIVNTANTYINTLTSSNGCDSIITTTLTVHPTFAINVYDTICDSESYLLPDGNFANSTGTYIATLPTVNGCDSVITTYLTVNPTSTISIFATICDSEEYTLPSGEIVNTANIYTNTLISSNGCDSIITTTLTVLNASSHTFEVEICKGESYTLPSGKNVIEQGIYQDTLSGIFGCDSIIITDLKIIQLDTTLLVEDQTITSNQTEAIYQWFNCSTNNIIIDETAMSYSPEENGSFAVIIEMDGCIDTSSCYQISVINNIDEKFKTQFKVYPNPSNDYANIDLGEEFSDIKIELFDITGKILISTSFKKQRFITIDLKPFISGTYFFHIIADDKKGVKKIIKE
ncbi:MAG: T9SS type A sorting domain-containing protein, partial [Bacteroidales bacterium]|nr:T9SS type A sorting domain-containing protein [Bacteroidales bacterium]